MARRLLLLAMLLAAVAIAAGGGWLLHTEAGFAWAVERLERSAGGALALENARGTLASDITVSRIRFSQEDMTIEARGVALRLSPLSLVSLAPRISTLHCAELVVTLVPDSGPSKPPLSLGLPLGVRVAEARVDRLLVKGVKNPVEVSGITFAYSGDRAGHSVQDAAIDWNGTRITGQGRIGAASPHAVQASVKARRAAAPAGHLSAELGGTLEKLQITAQAESAGARLEAAGTMTPYGPLPVERLKARVEGLDLRALEPALPRTALAGELALETAGGGLAGELRLANRLAGRYDSGRLPIESLSAAVRTDLSSAQLAELRIDLGAAGALSGSGEVAPGRLVLALQAAALNLAGIHGSLRATRLAGRIDLAARRESQSITADMAERGVRIALSADRAGEVVTLHDVRARARGGEARGRGRITLSRAQPFTAEATFAAFDPAAWGDFPAGAINGRATARGTLAEARAIDAEFTLGPSRLLGAPLSGKGRLDWRGERLTAVTADLELGGNRVELRGALGRPDDVLTLRVDAPRIAAIHPQWGGRARGTVQLSGDWRAPGAKFDLAAQELVFADRFRAATAAAKGEVSASPDGPLRIAATATAVSVPQGRVDQASAEVEGTRAAHTARLRARGNAIDLDARARGGWQPARGWAGTLQEFENRGQYAAKLEAPVSFEAGPGRLRVGAVAASIVGGRFDMRQLRYEEGRVVSEGSFTELRASTALALAGIPAAAGGTLRLSGSWALTASPRWNGTVAVRRDSGDISVDARNAVPLGLEALTLDARVVNDRVDFRGALRARVASGRIDGTLLPVATAAGERITGSSPLKFASSLEIGRLAALSGLTDATLRFDGRVRASLVGGGTLADPLVSGTVEGDDISIALPQEGVDLRGGELRAELAEREVRVQSFSIRGGQGVFNARGTLAHGTGRRATLEWQAERLAVLDRPDRRLVVTGRGKAALEGAKVSLSGEVRADEGVIELRATTLPAPGNDVVIVGRPQEGKEATRLNQALDLALDFGERFRIKGRGLDTLLAGKIRLQTGAAGNLVAKGTVGAVRGTYTAFGQRLALERGTLIFAGPVDNPALDIRAMRKMPTVEAGVEVAGTLRTPFVRVVSEPAMPENEALSWLVLGHGPGDAAGNDLAMLELAAAALLGQGTSPTGGVARAFGLDSIGMRGGGTVGNQFITFGKRITEDIYIIYEQSLGATANVLKLEFNLTPRVLLRAETGDTSAIGLFYRWAFD